MILTDLRHKAMELVISQPSEEYEPFTIHKTYEEFLSELIVKECMKLNRDILCEDNPDYLDEVYKEHFGVEE